MLLRKPEADAQLPAALELSTAGSLLTCTLTKALRCMPQAVVE